MKTGCRFPQREPNQDKHCVHLVDWFAFLDSVISFTVSVDYIFSVHSLRVWCLCPNRESCVCVRGKSLPRFYSAVVLVITVIIFLPAKHPAAREGHHASQNFVYKRKQHKHLGAQDSTLCKGWEKVVLYATLSLL